MDAARPHFDWPLEQLAEHAAQHAANRLVLDRIQEELSHRPGHRARRLESSVEHRIALLDGTAREEEMRGTLAAAAITIEHLRRRLAEAEYRAEEAERLAPQGASPHHRVFLTADAPLWLISEVRRAFRRRYHPDKQVDPEARRRAEVAFKRAEAVFASLPAAPEE
ncbi:hypothetical protein [Plastoroseomonas hellenica]|uniref:J domain-containing protein n=1 Tax=Plastoroseomonas hellenica TaxID=2687306 RepID=A0ABS5EWX8_9PROT|nr:hypothetical protein [Plastoroseomonas hellenica]MBR0642595.1 hypothetical protein [Plastoroseomonas hellenica]MBR0664807.1 hypothetical protein [Plastoroseomonas hellenica]